MRIAYFSPLNPLRSGISDYSEELLPHLAEYVDIDIFIDDYSPSNPEITSNFAVYNFRAFHEAGRRKEYDVALYQMGNHPCHEYIYHTLRRHPGVTVLHDYVLHHFILEITVAKGDEVGYVREMGYAYGAEGVAAAREALRNRDRIEYPRLRYPLNERIVDSSLGIIVHSDFARRLVQKSHPGTPVTRVSQGMDTDISSSGERSSLGLGDDDFVIGTFGLATPEKRLDVVLKAFKQFRTRFTDSVLLVVGDVPPWNNVSDLVDELGLDDCVRVTGFVDKDALVKYIRASDVCVNLRYPTCGETSAMVLRCMAAGKPVIVSNVGSFAELPDGACVKVLVDENEIDSVADSFRHLAESKDLRDELGLAAREHIRLEHDPSAVAKSYVDFIRGVLDGTN